MSGKAYVCKRCGDEMYWENVPEGEQPSEIVPALCNACQREIQRADDDSKRYGSGQWSTE